MVKCIGPLFSNSATGAVGSLVFQGSRNGTIARVNVPQRFRPSAAQVENNFRFGLQADNWRLLTPEEREQYNQDAKGLLMSGFNLYVKEHFHDPLP